MAYSFREANIDDIPPVLEIIKGRVAWMDKKGLKQWNCTNYLDIYTEVYFQSQLQNGNLFVAEADDGKIIGTMVLLKSDPRWHDGDSVAAYYVHNFATAIEESSIGALMIRDAEILAQSRGMEFLRLDHPEGNEYLHSFYSALGYYEKGKCVDRLYKGVCMEKSLL